MANDSAEEKRAHEMPPAIHSNDLNYVNQHHTYSESLCRPSPSSAQPPLLRTIVGKLRSAALFLLGIEDISAYVLRERDYQAHLVRVLNDLSRRIDFLHSGAESSPLAALAKQVSQGLSLAESLGESVRRLSSITAEQDEKLRTLDSVTRGLERILAACAKPISDSTGIEQIEISATRRDLSYLMLENRYRGSEAEIEQRLVPYADVFRGALKPVLEIGSGRGELQTLFRRQNIPTYGVELNQAMVSLAHEKQLDVRLEDALTHLSGLSPASLGGVIAIQVIEHLLPAQLADLLRLCGEKVASGGKVVLETINTQSILALCHNYFRDPTHVNPLHPETTQVIIEHAGLKVIEMRRLSLYPQGACLQEIPLDKSASQEWAALVNVHNHNVRELNRLIFGAQDYCIIAEVL